MTFARLNNSSVVIHDLFERGSAVVVEIRCRVSEAAESRHVELVPVVLGRRKTKSGNPRQQRPTRIRARATDRRAVRLRDFVGSCISLEAIRARRERKARRADRIDGTRTLRRDIVKSNDRELPGRLARTTMTLAARALEDDLTLLLEFVERRIRIRQRCTGPDSVRQGPEHDGS